MENVTKFWFLKDFNLFKKMGKKNLMNMCHLLKMINIKKGDILPLSQEDKKLVYFLKSGAIKITTEDTQHTRSVLNMGNVFGEVAIFEDQDSQKKEEQAIVLEDGVVCIIDTEQMKMMLEKHGSLKNQLLKLHGLRIRKLQRNLEDLLYKDSETRIREYVLNYIQDFGQKRDGVLVAKNLLSHQDIAHLTNTSRQTVSNIMSKLRKSGVIDYNAKEMIVL